MQVVDSARIAQLREKAGSLFPGILISLLVAFAAKFISEHYGAPAMLMALLFGMALGFLGEEGKTVKGIAFSSKGLLRLGVAFLGARISVDLVVALGPDLISLIIFGVVATIGFGLLIGPLFGRSWSFALLTAGSVAICGASAAMAIASILPKNDRSEQNLVFTVMGVTILSTIAMVIYPIIVELLELDTRSAGVFLGGTIHDVAQVVGAGFSVSEATGETSTLVKLIRVAMLAPVVLVASILIRQFTSVPEGGSRPPLLPNFVIGFLVLATLNSLHLIPVLVGDILTEASRWLLLTAIAAVGMKSNLKKILEVGGSAIGLIVSQTLFIGIVILIGLQLLT